MYRTDTKLTKPKGFLDEPHFSLGIAQSETEPECQEIIRKVMMVLSMDSVTHLYTYFYLPSTEQTWETVFLLLTALHTLELDSLRMLGIGTLRAPISRISRNH